MALGLECAPLCSHLSHLSLVKRRTISLSYAEKNHNTFGLETYVSLSRGQTHILQFILQMTPVTRSCLFLQGGNICLEVVFYSQLDRERGC